MLELSKPQRHIVKLLMTPHHLPLPHFFLEPQGSSSGELSFSVSLYQPSLICGALNIMLNYEDCWGIVVPMVLLSNPQPPSRVTGGSYGLKTFQISIKKIQGSTGPETKEGRRKRQAKREEKSGKLSIQQNQAGNVSGEKAERQTAGGKRTK